jgi:hypothetical protein
MTLRETGSILVHAPRERVLEVVRERMAHERGPVTVTDGVRIASRRATFVLQDGPDGDTTRVVVGRTAPDIAQRAELRREVADELMALQRLV